METYRLEIRERAGGIDADVYGEDELVEESTRAYFENYGIEADATEAAGNESDEAIEERATFVRETTTDVTSLDLRYERDGGGFDFRLVGDDDLLVSVRLDDDDLAAVSDEREGE